MEATTPQRMALRSPLTSPGSPSPASRRILVVVTLDAERYTPVDLTDVLDEGAVIRTRVLNKLGIWDIEEQAHALIYETEIGALAIGLPMTDQSLSEVCHERGDSRASLAFIVQRPPIRSSSLQTPPYSADSDHVPNTSSPTDRPQRNRSLTANEQHSPASTKPVTNGHKTVRPPLRRPTRPTEISIESNSNGIQDEPPPRRVRPLPAIPTPVSTPGYGTSVGSDSYPKINAVANEIDDLYDYSRGMQTTNYVSRVRGDMPSIDQPPQSLGRQLSSSHAGISPASTPVKWIRGDLIGNGKYGRVYLALDAATRKLIAVKQIEAPEGNLGMRSLFAALRSESEMLCKLDHKNIVKYIQFEETVTSVNIVMEYVPGGTLSNFLKSYAPFSENVTKFFLGQILEGLAYLHSHQVLHRDLRADNILVQQDGLCKISDFAISKHANKDGLVFTALLGSLFWMAPEVVSTKDHGRGYSSKVDIWSLGCLLLEMWSDGARPWRDLEAASVMIDLYESNKPPPLPNNFSITDAALDFYNQCFMINPDERPAAKQLQDHRYLKLAPDWNFMGFIHTPVIENIAWLKDTDKIPPQFMLDGFPRYSSDTHVPAEWLETNRIDLLEYIVQSKFHVETREECSDWAKSSILFPRLAIFSYEALYQLAELRSFVTTWKKWDTLTSLYKFDVVNNQLRSFYADMDQVDRLREIVALDVDAICIRLHMIVTVAEDYRRVLELRGGDAQSMLDLFQTLLDVPNLDRIFRSPFMNAMLRLSRRSGLHPSHLLQEQVSLEGDYAVAAGQFGDVWKGTFQGRQVAVKVLKVYQTSDLTKHFKNVLHETLIWRQLRHSNVLPFFCLYHVKNDATRIGLVSPWMENGNVQAFLRVVTDANRLSLIRDIAEGLEYLHTMQPNIVHGDLKAVNILITDTHRACLADFGLSKASESQVLRLTSFSSNQTGGTSRWTAPELLNGTIETNNAKSDVYAFACIFSGNIPFFELNSDYPVILKVTLGQRPDRPLYCEPHGAACVPLGLSDHLWEIVESCWKADPQDRPTMENVVKRLPLRDTPPPPGAERYNQLLDSQRQTDLITWSTTIYIPQ